MSDFAIARQRMVDGQVRPSDVTDLRIWMRCWPCRARHSSRESSGRWPIWTSISMSVKAAPAKRILIKPVVTRRCCRPQGSGSADKVLVAGSVVVKRNPVRTLHQPLIGRRRLADPGFDHDRADPIFVEQRFPFLDLVVAQGLARLFPLQEQFCRVETRAAVDVRLELGRHPSR